MGSGVCAMPVTITEEGMISYPALTWALCFTVPVTRTTDSLAKEVMACMTSGEIFFFGAVTWTTP